MAELDTPQGTPYTLPPGAIAAAMSKDKFGGATRPTFRALTVGITSTRVLDNNPRRVSWLIVNISVSQGNANFDNTVSSSNGIILGASGGSVTADAMEDGEAVTWEFFGINTGAAGVWWVYEVLRV